MPNVSHDGHTVLMGVKSLASEIPHSFGLRIDMSKGVKPLAELTRCGRDCLVWPLGEARYTAAVQSRLREATLEVLAEPQMRKRLQETGFEAAKLRSPNEMVNALRADYEHVGAVLRSSNFKPE